MVRLLNQRYRVTGRLGGGGMAEVYQAADTKLGDRLVAVKEMRQDKLASPEEIVTAVQAFKQEALMLAALRHQNLPRIYDHFQEAGNWYLVMDFIEGETLEDYVDKKGGKLPLQEALDLGIQLCTVLDYLHTRQPPIIFRDLKPSNIMRTPDGHMYLIDFGIARHFKPGQTRDTVLGLSLGYAAPEQFGGAQTSPQSDIYSLGATLYHLLTGVHPTFNQPSLFDFPPLRLPGQPPPLALERLMAQMVNKDMRKRPASMTVVKQELQRITDRGRTGPLSPGTLLCTYGGHSGAVGTIAWAPDGTRIASGGLGRVHVWEASTAKTLFIYGGHTDKVHDLGWSPNAPYIASASADRTIQVWSAINANPVLTYRHHSNQVHALAWAPDGTRIASGGLGRVHVWEASTAKTLFIYGGHRDKIHAVKWSPDGTRIASTGADQTVQVWSALHSPGAVLQNNVLTYRGHSHGVHALAWSPDGTCIASAGHGRVHLWDAATGNLMLTYSGHAQGVRAIIWSPDGKYIASAGQSRIHVWRAMTGSLVLIYQGHSQPINAIAWAPDGTRIASASDDMTVQVWQAQGFSEAGSL